MPPEILPFEQSKPREKSLRVPNVTIEQSGYEGLSTLDASTFSGFGDKAEQIHTLYGMIVEWLKVPYINDDFPSHEQRRKWYATLSTPEKEKMENNKLRTNVTEPIYNALILLRKALKDNPALPVPDNLFPDLSQDLKVLGDPSLDPIERKALIKRWEKQISRVVEFIEDCVRHEKLAA